MKFRHRYRLPVPGLYRNRSTFPEAFCVVAICQSFQDGVCVWAVLLHDK